MLSSFFYAIFAGSLMEKRSLSEYNTNNIFAKEDFSYELFQ